MGITSKQLWELHSFLGITDSLDNLVQERGSHRVRTSGHFKNRIIGNPAKKQNTVAMPGEYTREDILTIANRFTEEIGRNKQPLNTLRGILRAHWGDYRIHFANDVRPKTTNPIPYAHLDQGEVNRFLHTSKVGFLRAGSMAIGSEACTYDGKNLEAACSDEGMVMNIYAQLCNVLDLSISTSYRHSFATRNKSKPPAWQSQEILKELAWGDFRTLLSPKALLFAVRLMRYNITGPDHNTILGASLYRDEVRKQAMKTSCTNVDGRIDIINPTCGRLREGTSMDHTSMQKLTAENVNAIFWYSQSSLQRRYPLS